MKTDIDDKAWDGLVLKWQKPAHFMQSSVWKNTKAKSQWKATRLLIDGKKWQLPVQMFSRTVPGFGRLHYAPELGGVTADNIADVTKQLRAQYRRGGAIKVELYEEYSDDLIKAFETVGWRRGNSVQYRLSVAIDMSGSQDELFMSFKGRARNEIRMAQKSGVTVQQVEVTDENLDHLHRLMNVTSARSGAFFRGREYLDNYWHEFSKAGQGSLYFAYHEGDLLAAAYVIKYGEHAWYKDGGSVREKTELKAPRLLLWQIMTDLQAEGVTNFDLSGIPEDHELATSHMKGLYTFKTGFARGTKKFMPAMELPLGKLYPAWPKAERHWLRLYSGLKKDFWY